MKTFISKYNELFKIVSYYIKEKAKKSEEQSEFITESVIKIKNINFQYNLGKSFLVEISENFLIDADGQSHFFHSLNLEKLSILADAVKDNSI